MSSRDQVPVRRRRVFYIPGFDPFPPRRYRELYRTESAAQAKISGYEIALGPGTGDGFGWTVTARIDGQDVRSDIEVLTWSDLVQASMDQTIIATYLHLVRTAWIYISTGALWRLMRLRKGPVIAALYPVAALLLQLLVAVLLGAVGAHIAATGVERMFDLGAFPVARGIVFVLVLPLIVWAMLRGFRNRDNKIFAHYLMHDYAFAAQRRGANPPALETRLAAFQRRIAQALEDRSTEEVLVVGHSSGASLAVHVLARLLQDTRVAETPALALLTLGHVVPMTSFLPDAHKLRADLQFLSAQQGLTWVDVTAPGDGCCFALCDPVAVSGVAPPDKRWPLVFSAVFTKSLRPDTWARLKRRFFRLHFQYLCAFDAPRDYDYFQITAGPRTLADRYAGRPASRSRIDRAVSGYTSVAP